jgi:putative RNA 2'-phosphotransferase
MYPEHLIRTSKFLSMILRHRPEKIGLQLDDNGWASVAELLEKAAASGKVISRETLQLVVDNNDKKRFAFSDDGLQIRANQGHSIDIDLGLTPQQPPETLYHGTAEATLKSIRKDGLLPMKRQHVHLSKDEETAIKVGGRHGKPAVLIIRSGEMARQKHLFYVSDNGVWLTDNVPVGFITFPT